MNRATRCVPSRSGRCRPTTFALWRAPQRRPCLRARARCTTWTPCWPPLRATSPRRQARRRHGQACAPRGACTSWAQLGVGEPAGGQTRAREQNTHAACGHLAPTCALAPAPLPQAAWRRWTASCCCWVTRPATWTRQTCSWRCAAAARLRRALATKCCAPWLQNTLAVVRAESRRVCSWPRWHSRAAAGAGAAALGQHSDALCARHGPPAHPRPMQGLAPLSGQHLMPPLRPRMHVQSVVTPGQAARGPRLTRALSSRAPRRRGPAPLRPPR